MRRGPELVEWPGLPAAPHTECAALGAMLCRQDALDYGVRVLHRALIRSEWNRQVLLALLHLRRRQSHDKRLVLVTPIEVSQELVRMKKWQTQHEAYTYCHDLIAYCHAPENWQYYIDQVKATAQAGSFYALGEFLDLGAVLKGSVLQPDADPHRLAAAVRECVDLIERDGCADIQAIFSRTK